MRQAAARLWLLVGVTVVAVALVSPVAPAWAVDTDDPARPLALKVLNPPGMRGMPLQIIASAEPDLVAKLRAAGMSETDAREASEQVILPEMRRRSRELERLIEDVFIETFTPAELQAIPDPEPTAVRRAAAAKFAAVTVRSTQVANRWLDAVRQDVITANNDRFKVQVPVSSVPPVIQ